MSLAPAAAVPLSALALAAAPFALAQAPQWRQVAPPGAGPFVAAPGVACDHLRDRIVLFGGNANSTPAGDTWELDGNVWTLVASSTPPPPRISGAMVFDGRRGETVLFGGLASGAFLGDTWTWNGSTWTQRFPLHAPPPFFGPMVFDDLRGVASFFDGQGLWEWNGVDWLQRTSVRTPPQRRFAAMAHDSRRDRVVLFGGEANGAPLADTWEWDGVDWQQVPATFPFAQGVGLLAMAYDRERARCVMLGTTLFSASAPGFPVCCEFDGTTWTTSSAPPAPGVLVADRRLNRIVALLDSAGTGRGTWAYESAGLAVAQPFGLGCGSPVLALREDPAARPVLGQTLRAHVDGAPLGVAFMAFGWSDRQVSSPPLSLPLRLDAFGLPGCWLLQSGEAIALPCTGTGPTSARFDVPIPQSPGFAGMRFALQPWAPTPGSNPAGVVTGNGLAVTIGTR